MKKLNLLALSLIVGINAFAEGYQVNTLSTRQLAMGHTGVALKLGAESMYFNPAGMAFMDKTLDLSVGVTGIAATAHCTHDGTKYTTDNNISTPLFAYAGFRIYDNLKAGVAFYTPYGSSINWTNNWPGAVLSQKVNLQTYVVQPTVAWKITDRLSIGAGLTVAWGKVDLNKGLVNPKSMDVLLAATGNEYRFGDITPASVNLKGTANIAVGFNVGAMYDINEKFTIGASFRSKMSMVVKSGEATVSYANKIAETMLQDKVGLINEANFTAEMPMPYTLTFGLSYRPNNRLEFAADAQFTGWNAYENLDINFLSEKLSTLNQHLEKNYHNSWAIRVGAKYDLTSRFDLRAGISYDMTPVDNEYYNPETPGMGKIAPSLGFSFYPISRLSIDVSCAYVAGLGADDVSYTYDDMIYKLINPALTKQTFKASYSVNAWTPSLGVTYSF